MALLFGKGEDQVEPEAGRTFGAILGWPDDAQIVDRTRFKYCIGGLALDFEAFHDHFCCFYCREVQSIGQVHRRPDG